MSSRNGYLSIDERTRAPALYRALTEARETLMGGDRDYGSIRAYAFSQLTKAGFEVDYFEIRRRLELAPAQPEDEPGDDQLIVLGAACLGAARLIDNIKV
jgi:pantoate--beta-alanine ligase